MNFKDAVFTHPFKSVAEQRANQTGAARRLLRQFIDASCVAMLIESESGAVLLANRAAEQLLKRSEAELSAAPVGSYAPRGARIDPALDPSREIDAQTTTLELDDSVVKLVTLFDRSSGQQSWASVDALLRRSRAREEHLSHLASHDPLTGLLNRRGLALELASENRRSRRSGASLAAILIDCDDFKHVNEELGHSGGDRALRELATRLEGVLRPTDRLGRIGGDEFLVLLPETRLAEASAVAERLRVAVSTVEFASPHGVVQLTASLGVEAVLDDAPSLESIVALAEESLSQSKAEGKNRATASGAPALSQARALLVGLRAAKDVQVLEHPVVRLIDSQSVGSKLELCDRRGPIERPSELVRSTLEDDLLEQIDLECLRLCLAGASADANERELHVELLPSTLLRANPMESVAEFARAHPARRVCVELSEQQVVGDPAALLPAIAALRSARVRLALKDMSFARAALEALIVLEPEVVKLDAHAVRLAASDVGRERSLKRLARVAGALGCELHAVGVDTQRELEFVTAAGVQYGQGLLWSSALPAFCEPAEGSRRSRRAANGPTT